MVFTSHPPDYPLILCVSFVFFLALFTLTLFHQVLRLLRASFFIVWSVYILFVLSGENSIDGGCKRRRGGRGADTVVVGHKPHAQPAGGLGREGRCAQHLLHTLLYPERKLGLLKVRRHITL